MKIYSLDAIGPHRAHLGIFTSKKKADNAWRRFRYGYRGTVWENAKKFLGVEITDTFMSSRRFF